MGRLLNVVTQSIAILETVMAPEGFNVGLNLGRVAGAGIEDHLHMHIVPRWSGDHNVIAVLGELRVISEHIKQTCSKLKPHFDRLELKE